MQISDQIISFSLHEKQAINEQFLEMGWVLVDLPSPAIILEVKEILEKKLKNITSISEINLESYHHYVDDDSIHESSQIELSGYFRENSFGPRIIEAQVEFFRDFIGPDIAMQTSPYLRITRPGKKQDNIGYHRDTAYGGSPFEVSVWIPFVEVDNDNCISVLPGSNTKPESAYPVKGHDQSKISKGSPLHLAGFPYRQLVIEKNIDSDMLPIPVKTGQALIFSLSTVHGSTANNSNTTRWSMDTRLLNKFAPVDLSNRPYEFLTISQSAITEQAYRYFRNQIEE